MRKTITAIVAILVSINAYVIHESFSVVTVLLASMNSLIFLWAAFIFFKVQYYIKLLKEAAEHLNFLKKEIKEVKDNIPKDEQ